MAEHQIEAVAINAGSDLTYFTSLSFHLSERPVILIIPVSGQPVFIFPEFEKEKVTRSPVELQLFPYQEDPQKWPKIIYNALMSLRLIKRSIAVSPLSFRFLEIHLMQTEGAQLNFISASEIFKEMHIRKDQNEISAIQKAVVIAENALLDTIPFIERGKTEKEIANQLFINLLVHGSEPDLPFDPIVASGPNSADPHALPGERRLEKGDLLIIDWGARCDGYVSDITRTFVINDAQDQLQVIFDIVLQANQKARQRVAPGIPASQVDATARDFINAAGYGEQFIHRTGHGIGLREHEEPFISSTDKTELAEGMVFTIEPGIYLSGLGGVRIEDDVAVTSDGVKTLTQLPRDLIILEK